MSSSSRTCGLLISICFSHVATTANASFIRTNKDCYSVGEDIRITFVNANPLSDDFIGMYSPTASLKLLPNVDDDSHWLWPCGTCNCTSFETGNTNATVSYINKLPVGTWKAVLARNNANYHAKMETTLILAFLEAI